MVRQGGYDIRYLHDHKDSIRDEWADKNGDLGTGLWAPVVKNYAIGKDNVLECVCQNIP